MIVLNNRIGTYKKHILLFLSILIMVSSSTATSADSAELNDEWRRQRPVRLARKNSFINATAIPDEITTTQRDFVNTLSTFTAGVGSGALASIICAPLDLIRTRMQVWGEVLGRADSHGKPQQPLTIPNVFRSIVQEEGWQGCFRGLGATLVTVPLFWGVYFPIYDETKYQVTQRFPNCNPSLVHCGSAVFTGAIADLICNPLFVIRTRLQTQALHNVAEGLHLKSGMWQTARELYQTHGPAIFWRGMTANMIGLSHVAVQFPAYEQLKLFARQRRPENKETALDLLLASFLAKMTASLLTYPHEVLRSRMMDSRASIAPTLRGTAWKIWNKEGIGGFYTGLPVTLIRVIPNCCITFLTYELLLRWSQEQIKVYRKKNGASNLPFE